MDPINYYRRVLLYYAFRLFPIDNNKIFIVNFDGKGYGESPKYIVEEIIKRQLNYKMVWAVKNKTNSFPEIVIPVYINSVRAIYEEVTAKIWINNTRKDLCVRKRKNQFYIQTWHGDFCFKKIEKDVENTLPKEYIQRAKHDSGLIDVFLSSSQSRTVLYKTAFWYKGEIFECGSPREDIFFHSHESIKNKVFKYFNIKDNNIRIILYAPTFRNVSLTHGNLDIYKLDWNLLLNRIREKTSSSWIVFSRLHPNLVRLSAIVSSKNYNDIIIDATYYDDIQELIVASDILITDYSGCMYEFALLNKPVFLYVNDYKDYFLERGFYVDLESLPFPYAFDINGLIDNIVSFNGDNYLYRLKEFFSQMKPKADGRASERVVDRLLCL
jgi:CDP-glycerol glycerophosphotransferase